MRSNTCLVKELQTKAIVFGNSPNGLELVRKQSKINIVSLDEENLLIG
jgi:hypothetical protein